MLVRFERLCEKVGGEENKRADVFGVDEGAREEYCVKAGEEEKMSVGDLGLKMLRDFAAEFEKLVALDGINVRIRRDGDAVGHAVVEEEHELIEEKVCVSLQEGFVFRTEQPFPHLREELPEGEAVVLEEREEAVHFVFRECE